MGRAACLSARQTKTLNDPEVDVRFRPSSAALRLIICAACCCSTQKAAARAMTWCRHGGVAMKFSTAIVCLAFASCASSAVLCGLQPAQAQAQYVQQGSKLICSTASSNGQVGNPVSLSADGNTAIVGGPRDNGQVGEACIFTRNDGIWTQGPKLVGSGSAGNS